jgi:hypothetical protein
MWLPKRLSPLYPGVSTSRVPIPHGAGNTNVTPFTFTQSEFYPGYEVIDSDDTPGIKEKLCRHVKQHVFVPRSTYKFASKFGATSWWEWSDDSASFGWDASPFGEWDAPVSGLPLLYSGSLDSPSLDGVSGLQGLIDDSLTAVLPGIRPNLSLVNSIYELKDFKSLPHTLARIRNALPKVVSLLKSRGFRGFGGSLRELTRTSADGYLQTEFNILPLLSDIAGLNHAIQNVQTELKKLIAGQGSVQTRHYKRALSNYSNSDEEKLAFFPYTWLDGESYQRRVVRYNVAMFNATVKYSYRLPDMSARELLLRALLDSLGVNLNPRIIWNAIKFSFVVDWVAGVGRWLDQFKKRNIEPVCHIHSYVYSIHISRTVQTFKQFGRGAQYMEGSTVPCISLLQDTYQRVPNSVDVLRSIKTSGLDPKEFSLAAALVAVRL